MARRRPTCVLWDFGDTLVDERWMRLPPAAVPQWAETYNRLIRDERLADRWDSGKLNTAEVAEHVSASLSMTPDEVLRHMHYCCSQLRFFDIAMDSARRCGLPQAIVTINPDIFSEHVVPNYQLNAPVDTIVTSWQERNLDKSDLCDIALDQLGHSDRSTALLIDNKQENVDDWELRGGMAYHFEGDAKFGADRNSKLEIPLKQ